MVDPAVEMVQWCWLFQAQTKSTSNTTQKDPNKSNTAKYAAKLLGRSEENAVVSRDLKAVESNFRTSWKIDVLRFALEPAVM